MDDLSDNATPNHVAVLGPGGVGGLLAGLLARTGCRVTCVAREGTAAHLREHGLHVHSDALGGFTAAVEATTQLTEPVDACLVAVKATALAESLERVPPAALGDGLVVPFLNGVEHVARLRDRYPPAQVVPATIRVESTRVAAGEIAHTSPFAAVELAGSGARVRGLAARLADAGLDVRVRDDETAMLWDKLSFLAPMALLTTAVGAPAGVVRSQHRDRALAVVAEVAAVARAEGADVDADGVSRLLDSVPAAMESSMQRDAAAGRPIELEAIGGAVLRAAERHGLAVPSTAAVVDALRRSEAAAR